MTARTNLRLQEADQNWKDRILGRWSRVRPHWLHVDDGFTIVATQADEIVGFISVKWAQLPPPLLGAGEGFIDIIEVQASHRRQGIGRSLVAAAISRCRRHGLCQVRAWSSEDKVEAISMWRTLGFALCPAVEYPNNQPVRGYFVAYRLG